MGKVRHRQPGGCWNCGSIRHHHRHCDGNAGLNKGRANIKAKVKTVNRKGSKSLKDGPLLPRELLSTEMGKYLYILEEIKHGLGSIRDAEITTESCKNKLDEAITIGDKFRQHREEIEDLIVSAKYYKRVILEDPDSERNTSDDLFRFNLEKLEKKSKELWARCRELVAGLRKVWKILGDVMPKFAALFVEVENAQNLFRSSSCPELIDLEELAERMKQSYILLKALRDEVNELETVFPIADVRSNLEFIQESMDLIWEEKHAAEAAVRQLRYARRN